MTPEMWTTCDTCKDIKRFVKLQDDWTCCACGNDKKRDANIEKAEIAADNPWCWDCQEWNCDEHGIHQD